jgi:hypothetical protein
MATHINTFRSEQTLLRPHFTPSLSRGRPSLMHAGGATQAERRCCAARAVRAVRCSGDRAVRRRCWPGAGAQVAGRSVRRRRCAGGALARRWPGRSVLTRRWPPEGCCAGGWPGRSVLARRWPPERCCTGGARAGAQVAELRSGPCAGGAGPSSAPSGAGVQVLRRRALRPRAPHAAHARRAPRSHGHTCNFFFNLKVRVHHGI